MRRRDRLGLRWASLLVLPMLCAACTDRYLARRDTLTISSGDAVARNAAVQTLDPWPAVAERTDDIVSGQRLQRAVERYRNPSPASAGGGFGPGGFGPGGFGAGADAAPVSSAPPLR